MTLPLAAISEGRFISFLHLPVCRDLHALEADIAILGIPHGVPYGMHGVANDSADAPAAVRAQSARFGAEEIDHYDFDLGGPLLDGLEARIVDCGDVPGDPLDIPGNVARAQAAVQTILARGAVPIVLGGDDAIPIPVFRAYEGRGPITLVQIDAHIDWRHEIGGVTEGYSSPMRRASEMPWIGRIVQVGMRGVGSARPAEVRDALAYGAKIITAREVHQRGADFVLGQIPDGGDYLITIDCDGLDPTVMPGVNAPTPGGLGYYQVLDLLHGVARKGRIAGCDIVELAPSRDPGGISALTAGRLVINLIGAMVRAGQFTKR
jgi:agmatinase